MDWKQLKKTVNAAKEKLGDRNAELMVEALGITDYDSVHKKCCCPFHNEKTPSFYYWSEKYRFKCFGKCGRSCDLIDVYKLQGMTYGQACEKICDEAGIPLNMELGIQSRREYRYPHHESDGDYNVLVDYYSSRGISEKTLKYADVCINRGGWIVFHYYDLHDTLTMVKYRLARAPRVDSSGRRENKCSGQKDADTAPLLFNMNRVNLDDALIVCEGESDCLTLIECGFLNAVSVPNGAGNTRWIQENYEWLMQFQEIIICADNDEAGIKMRKESCRRLDSCKTKYVEIPKLEYTFGEKNTKRYTKDINDVLAFFGKDMVVDIINNAKEAEVESVSDMSKIEPIEYEDVGGVNFGLKPLDNELMRCFYGTLTIITGQPGAGKSSLLTQMMCNALDHNINSWLFSGELSNAYAKSWFNFIFAGPRNIVETEKYDGTVRRTPPAKILGKINDFYKGKWFIYKDDKDTGFEALLSSMTSVVRKYNVKFLILDNFMMIDTECDANEELRMQTQVIKKLIEFAKKYEVCVVLVAHPKKTENGRTPGLEDVSGSMNIVNLAHRAIVLSRITDSIRNDPSKMRGEQYLKKYDVVATILKDRMFGRQYKKIGLYYDNASRRFYTDYDEYDYKYNWDQTEYTARLPLPEQLVKEKEVDEEIYGTY